MFTNNEIREKIKSKKIVDADIGCHSVIITFENGLTLEIEACEGEPNSYGDDPAPELFAVLRVYQ